MSTDDNNSTAMSEDVLIVLPVKEPVLFPGVVLPIAIHGKHAVAAAQEAVRTQRRVGLLLQTDENAEEPGAEGLHRVGTIASIVRFVTAADGSHHVICQGEQRFTVLDYVNEDPFSSPASSRIGNRRSLTAKSKHAASTCEKKPPKRCSCCRRHRLNSPMPFEPSNPFPRWPISSQASWT